jgi:hypothetical protein
MYTMCRRLADALAEDASECGRIPEAAAVLSPAVVEYATSTLLASMAHRLAIAASERARS